MTLHNQSIKQKLLKGGSWALIGKMISALLGVIMNALLARLLSPEELGAYFLLMSLVGIVSMLAQFGMPQLVVKSIASSLSKGADELIRPVVYFVLVIVLCVSSILLSIGEVSWVQMQVVSLFKSEYVNMGYQLAFLMVPFMALQVVLAEMHRGFHDIRMATIFGGLTSSFIAALVFMVYFSFQGEINIQQAFEVMLGSMVLTVVFSFYYLKCRLVTFPSQKRWMSQYTLLSSSFPLLLYAIMFSLLSQAPLWLVGIYLPEDQVALFGAASRLIMLITMPLLIVNAVVSPIIAELLAKQELHKLENVLRSTASVAGWPALLVLIIFMLFATSVLSFVYGEIYRQAGEVLMILCAGQITNVWSGSCGLTLLHAGYEKLLTLITIFSGVATVLLGVYLTQRWGIEGMAIAASSGIAMQNIILLVSVKIKVGIATHMKLIPNMLGVTGLKNEK